MKSAIRALAISRAAVAACVGLALSVVLAGCGGDGGRETPSQTQDVSEVMQEQMDAEDGTAEEAPANDYYVAPSQTTYTSDQVNIDLTVMGADMVYATVYDMVTNPANYVGQVVRMSGPYYHTLYEGTGLNYYYVIVEDAAACCSQGLEFVWDDGSHVYPDDYPVDGTPVTVTGVFEIYNEEGMDYVHLTNSQLVVGYTK